MSQPMCYGFDPEYTDAEFAAIEERRGAAEGHVDVVGDAGDGEAPGAAPDPAPDRRDNNDWCLCGNCPVMPTVVECRCCREIGQCREIQQDGCIIDADEFSQVCLTRSVLRVFHVARRDIRGHRPHVPRELENKSLRFAAYKLFTYLIHGYLGKGVRKVVPACATTRIRREFPELSAVYIGFKHGDDGEIIEVPEQFAI